MSEDLIRRFEDGTLPASEFRHRHHVHVAWIYLKEGPTLPALERFISGLKRFAERIGRPDVYNETTTWAYLLVIQERIARAPEEQTWEEFEAGNPDLFVCKPSVLDAYYREETLASDLARRVFLMPDLNCGTLSQKEIT